MLPEEYLKYAPPPIPFPAGMPTLTFPGSMPQRIPVPAETQPSLAIVTVVLAADGSHTAWPTRQGYGVKVTVLLPSRPEQRCCSSSTAHGAQTEDCADKRRQSRFSPRLDHRSNVPSIHIVSFWSQTPCSLIGGSHTALDGVTKSESAQCWLARSAKRCSIGIAASVYEAENAQAEIGSCAPFYPTSCLNTHVLHRGDYEDCRQLLPDYVALQPSRQNYVCSAFQLHALARSNAVTALCTLFASV